MSLILLVMGFQANFVDLIMSCISTVSFSIMINRKNMWFYPYKLCNSPRRPFVYKFIHHLCGRVGGFD